MKRKSKKKEKRSSELCTKIAQVDYIYKTNKKKVYKKTTLGAIRQANSVMWSFFWNNT